MIIEAKTIDVLVFARDLIVKRKENYICLAITRFYPWDAPVIERALRLIHTRMQYGRFTKWVDKQRICEHDDPYTYCDTSLEWWLVWKGYVKVDAMPTSNQMNEYRVAWLTALIEELKAKGD